MKASATYRDLLKDEFEARCGRNPRYSLRSFARDLAVTPARLSDVLRGRYGLSREAALAMALTAQVAAGAILLLFLRLILAGTKRDCLKSKLITPENPFKDGWTGKVKKPFR